MNRRVLAACALLALAQAGCGPRSSAGGKRLIVLGIDAMDPAFLERHWSELPNLDGLRREGEFKRLATAIPPQSPVAWSTFITGLDPGGHGIYDFVHRDPKTMLPFSSMAETERPKYTLPIGPYEIPLSSGKVKRFLHGRPFWLYLDDAGIPARIIRVPNNFPPVESKSLTLSGMGTPDMRGTFGTFTFFTDDPIERTRSVPGGQIVRVDLEGYRATLTVDGPDNTLRKDGRRTTAVITVDVDPDAPAGRFRAGETTFVLKEGEWSGWIRVRFPLIPGLESAAGMFRVYAKSFHPRLGVYVSPVNIDPGEPELPISTPDSYSRELAAAVGPFYTQGIGEDTAALREGVFTLEEYVRQSRMVSAEHLRLLDHEMDRFREGMLFFHFFGIDQDSHVLWGKHEDKLLETYRLVDAALGGVMKKAGDATLIVMSDHGFTSFDRAVHLNTWLWREGFLELDNPDNAGDDELFPHVDWSRTQAYSMGLTAIYVNQAGRDKNGVVAPGAETEEVVRRISERLLELRDPANGRQVIEAVYPASKYFHGEAAGAAPDLVVGYAPGYRSSWQTALGAVPKATIEDNKDEWRGDHCIASERVPGVWLSNRRSKIADPHLRDVTVTVLAAFGIAPGPGMRGRPLF